MKKAMFGLVCAAAMAACAEITSANVVGYTTKDLRTGSTMLAPCFQDVGKGGIDLTSISVDGYDKEEGTAGDVIVEILGPWGSTTAKYFWYDVVDGEDVIKGWFDGDDNLVEAGSVVFQSGDGLWVSGVDGYKLTFPGEVIFDDVSKALRNGSTPTGNMMAVAQDLTSVEVSGYDTTEGTAGDVIIEILGPWGSTTAKYFWYDVADGEDVIKGWFDGDDNLVEEGAVKFQPGDGLWVSGLEGLFLNVLAPAL